MIRRVIIPNDIRYWATHREVVRNVGLVSVLNDNHGGGPLNNHLAFITVINDRIELMQRSIDAIIVLVNHSSDHIVSRQCDLYNYLPYQVEFRAKHLAPITYHIYVRIPQYSKRIGFQPAPYEPNSAHRLTVVTASWILRAVHNHCNGESPPGISWLLEPNRKATVTID